MEHYLIRNTDYLVAVKPPQLCCEEMPDGSGYCNLLQAENPGFLAPVYRLDRGVGGVILYARNPESAAFFSALVRDHALEKEYAAVLCGVPEESGILRDLLYFDRKKNKSYVVTRPRNGVKEAVLSYRVLRTWTDTATGKPRTLVAVRLETGRTHQIRVQFASRGMPLLGDRRYGGDLNPGNRDIALWCRSITLPAYLSHPAAVAECEPPFGKESDFHVD